MNSLVLTGIAAVAATVGIAAYTGDLGTVVEPVVRDCARHIDLSPVRQDGGMSSYCKTLLRILVWQKGEIYAKRLVISEGLSNLNTGNPMTDALAKRLAERAKNGDFDKAAPSAIESAQ
ncbi:hypothetical protein [Mesorhizobium huakuii]|uniref:hypothetical protein n=1 Tax=Mesorhizobium huakuii TaxID=28104 RepID=UPI0024E18CBD|nr:hypothetical protein [Mesorhizobium huakuii]